MKKVSSSESLLGQMRNPDTYRDQEAEGDQPHDPEDEVARERQEGVEKWGDEHNGEDGADGGGNDAVDDPAIPRDAGIREPVQERTEDAKHDYGADELPDAQAHQHDLGSGSHGDCWRDVQDGGCRV